MLSLGTAFGSIQFNCTTYKCLVLKGALLKLVEVVTCLHTCSQIYAFFSYYYLDYNGSVPKNTCVECLRFI